ncbi:uncharacterized protein LOC135837310 [Planococcus citri]|uniref:uncharacterized protein LOC135837310 n=1 Tax=Planococcus citri TaxID=170843 RepID=UPI0031F99362
MCSCSTMKIIFFILLQLTGIYEYSTQEISLENDITKHIDKWVTTIFNTSIISEENAVKTISEIHKTELNELKYNNISNQGHNLHPKCIFQNVVYYDYDSSLDWCYGIQIEWKSYESKIIRAFFDFLHFDMDALVKTGEGNYKESSQVPIEVTFRNVTSTASRLYTRDNGLKITYSYDFTHSSVDYRTKSAEDKKQLDRVILPILPTILRDQHVSTNQKTIRELEDVFQEYEKPSLEMISTRPDFLSNPQKYYYLIPRTPIFCFILKRIVIHGISNFESYKTHCELYIHTYRDEIFTHTLLIRNLQGSMTLDYQSEKEKALKLNFQVDCFNLTKKDDTYCVHGHAKDYTITRANTNVSLSSLQSEVIMNRLESALASALSGLPSMKIGQICDVEIPIEKIETSNCSDWETMKESYKEWIPFNDDEVIKRQQFE